jgi:S-DNA-T family DNA segregation ATPase FtsK/SpoIIIE
MRRVVTGEELAQIHNPDPFAMPRWRAPVYRTPLGIILAAKLARLLAWVLRMIARHPLASAVLALAAVAWVRLGWVTLVALVLAAAVMLAGWWWFWPVSFARWVARPARSTRRAWRYRRRWAAVLAIGPVRGRLRRSCRQPGARVPGATVPGPHREVRRGGAGVHPPGRPGRHRPRPAHP